MKLRVLDQRAQPMSGPLNMAWDEALLERATEPVLRFYAWDGPWVSFGYFQHAEDAKMAAGGRPLVRRWTGGGIVFHSEDLTYSLIVPITHPFAKLRPTDSYKQVHAALVAALKACEIPATLTEKISTTPGGPCFVKPVPGDVLSAGKKIAGAAQRRTKQGLLHQGSILLESVPECLVDHFIGGIRSLLGLGGAANAEIPPREIVEALASVKYS